MKILGVDFGIKKTGLAVGETETCLAEPMGTFSSRKLESGLLLKIIRDLNVDKVVFGFSSGNLAEKIKEFAQKLTSLGITVDFFEETLTTREAKIILGQNRRSLKQKKEREDAVAAAIMIQSYLEVFKKGNV